MTRVLVMGIGSLVHRDDGVGPRAIHALERLEPPLPDAVALVDAGTSIVDQIGALEDAGELICIDAALGGGSPGTIYRFSPDDVRYRASRFHDLHKLTLFDVLAMAGKLRGRPLAAAVLAMEPATVEWGTELSVEVAAALPRLVELAAEAARAAAAEIPAQRPL